MPVTIFFGISGSRRCCGTKSCSIAILHRMMHFCIFAIVNTFDHFGTNKGTACYYTVERNHFTEVLGSKGTGVDVMVAEGTLETNVEYGVIVDVSVLTCTERR